MKASSELARLSELALRQRRQGLANQLPPVVETLRGPLVERYVTCGNPACKCAKGFGTFENQPTSARQK